MIFSSHFQALSHREVRVCQQAADDPPLRRLASHAAAQRCLAAWVQRPRRWRRWTRGWWLKHYQRRSFVVHRSAAQDWRRSCTLPNSSPQRARARNGRTEKATGARKKACCRLPTAAVFDGRRRRQESRKGGGEGGREEGEGGPSQGNDVSNDCRAGPWTVTT